MCREHGAEKQGASTSRVIVSASKASTGKMETEVAIRDVEAWLLRVVVPAKRVLSTSELKMAKKHSTALKCSVTLIEL